MNEYLLKGIVRFPLDDGRINGPGFFVSQAGHILTCFHTVKPLLKGDKVQVLISDKEESCTATLLSKEDQHAEDLALLKVDYTPEVIFNIRPFASHSGKDFITYGYPEEMTGGMYGRGKIFDTTQVGFGQFSSKEVRSGFSGGPVVVSGTNDTVGVIKNKYNDRNEIVAHFCIPGETILRLFPDLKPRYEIYPPDDLHKYKCLVIHHPNTNNHFNDLSIRSVWNNWDDRLVFRSYCALFSNQPFEKEKFLAAIQQSNCILFWICGNDFVTLWQEMKSFFAGEDRIPEKDLLLVNASASDNDFEKWYRKFKVGPLHRFPTDDPNFQKIQLEKSIINLANVCGGLNGMLDQFLQFLDDNLITFQDKLLRQLFDFDYTLQRTKVLNDIQEEDKFIALSLKGTERCGLEVLAQHIVGKTEGGNKLVRPIDFETYDFQNLEDLVLVLEDGRHGAEGSSVDNWLTNVYQNDSNVFFIWQNFLLPSYDESKINRHLALAGALIQKLESAQPPHTWKGRLIFLLLNKTDRTLALAGSACKVIDLPAVTQLDSKLGVDEVKRWKENISAKWPAMRANHLKAHISSEVHVGAFLLQTCRLFHAEHLYHQHLAKL